MIKLIKIVTNIFYAILPKKIFNFLAYLNGFKYFKISYSQYGEDLVLLKYLDYKKIKNGKYLDIGAFHPVWLSNTNLLDKKGFTGYCVDLDEERLEWFRFRRGDRVKTICGAVSNSNDEYIDIYKYQRKTPFSQVDTTSIDFAKRYSSKTNTKFETKKVKNYHIDDIYKKVGKVDVLNIDIEGKDFETLKSSNLEIIDPEIILIEDHDGYFPSNELKKFFTERDYELISICGLTKCFAKR